MKTLIFFAFLAPIAAIAGAPASAQVSPTLTYHVGQRVEYVDFGTWYKAVVREVRVDRRPYLVHPIGYITTMDRWVLEVDVRQAGSGATSPIPGGAAGEANDEVLKAMRSRAAPTGSTAASGLTTASVAVRKYHCVGFSGSSLIDKPPFTINSGSRYTDVDGVHGTYTYGGGVITFHGGKNDAQQADYETANGRPNVHFISPGGRRRGVIDCD